jgi:hypothetical protein
MGVMVTLGLFLVILICLGGLPCVGVILGLIFAVFGTVVVMHFLDFVEHGLQGVLFWTSL